MKFLKSLSLTALLLSTSTVYAAAGPDAIQAAFTPKQEKLMLNTFGESRMLCGKCGWDDGSDSE